MLTASWAGGKMAAAGVGLMGSLESQDVSFPGASGRLPFMSHQPEVWVTNPFPCPSLEGEGHCHDWFRLLRIYPGSGEGSPPPPSHVK